MDGMDRALAFVLASRGICHDGRPCRAGRRRFIDIEDMTEERAAELIMTARAPWFAEEEEATA